MCFSFHKSPSIPACVIKIFANGVKSGEERKKAVRISIEDMLKKDKVIKKRGDNVAHKKSGIPVSLTVTDFRDSNVN